MSLDNVKPGDKLTADAWNQLVAAARSKSTVRGTNGLSVKNLPNGVFMQGEVQERILAEIVCCGDCDQKEGCPPDGVIHIDKDCQPQDADNACCKPKDVDGCELEQFQDPRYWCVFSTIDPAGFCDALTTTMRDPCTDVKWKKVVAYNLAEDNCQSHLLPPGTIVELSSGYTTESPPQKVYWFTRTPMPKAKEVDECSDRHCDCPSSSDSSSSSSSSSSNSSSSSESSSHSKSHSDSDSSSSHSDSSHSHSSKSHSYSHPVYSSSDSHSHSHSHSNSNSNSESVSTSNSNSTSQSQSHSSPSNSTNPSNSNSNSTSQSSPSTNPSNSTNPSHSGSDKSTAIVPASWSKSGYTALFIAEMPEVRFDDVIVNTVPQRNCVVPIDPKFLEVCEADSVQVCGCVSDEPIAIGAKVNGNKVDLKFAAQSDATLQVVIRLTGVRKGFANHRFPDRTAAQFEANERFIRSAY